MNAEPHTARVDILAFVLCLHEKLANARSGVGGNTATRSVEAPERSASDVHPDTSEVVEEIQDVSLASAEAREALAAERRECFICLEQKPTAEFVEFRGRTMCADCRQRLR